MDETRVQEIVDMSIQVMSQYGLKVIGAIAVLIIGRILAGMISGAVRKALVRAEMEPSLVGFLSTLVRFAVLAFAIVSALGAFGIETASFAAVLAAGGLAVGLALQGSLSNFAAGVMLLIFRPFKVGSVIDAAGVMGKVQEIGVFTTTLHTPDNKKIIVPNGAIISGTITNITANATRRVDMTAGISYADDVNKARKVFMEILEQHPKVLQEPAPVVRLNELADSSVNFVVRPWARTEDYWDVYFDVMQAIKEECDKNGISIPFPQRDVHMHQMSA